MQLPQVTLNRLIRCSIGPFSLLLLLLSSGWAAHVSTQTQKVPLTASLPSIDFGTVTIGSSATQNETLTNVTQNTVTIYQTSTTGSGFSISGLTPPITLTAGQSYTFSVIFAPQSSGTVSGNFQVISRNGKNSFSVPLSGTGATAGALSVSPATESFGNVTVGSSSTLPGTLTASGTSVTISGATTTNSEFSLSGITFPLTLSAGKSATFNLIFSPGSSGATTGVLTFNSSANSASQSLSGTGVSAPQHSVSLVWDASTSVVNGYNVYRGTTTGGPYSKLNSSLDALTSYVDMSVVAGSSYYYVTTAVDSSGKESSYSNEVNALIPTP